MPAFSKHAGQVSSAADELNVDLEAERLYAMVDGLAVHAVVRPERATDDLLTSVLTLHLDSLARNINGPA